MAPEEPKGPTPEQIRATVLRAQELVRTAVTALSGERMNGEEFLMAAQMLVAYSAVGVGVSFDELMRVLAQNMPTMYGKWFEMAESAKQKQVNPATLINLDEFRKNKE
jgi:hypothetical protein